MINQKLSVVHLGEYLYVGIGVEFEQMLYLRLGHECLFCAVPEMYVISRYVFQFSGIYRFVSVADGFAFTVWPHFEAFVQENVHVM